MGNLHKASALVRTSACWSSQPQPQAAQLGCRRLPPCQFKGQDLGLCLYPTQFACSWLKVLLSKYQISPLSAHVRAGTPVQYSFWDHSDLRDITFEIFHYRVAFLTVQYQQANQSPI